MADQAFPYHLAGFAMGALATGYTISSLKQYHTRPVNSIKETAADPNLLPQSQTRKRKRVSDETSLPATKRRPDAVNTPPSANDVVPSDDLNTPSPIKSVKIASNSEQDSVEIKISNGSSRPAHHVLTGSHYGVKISFRELRHRTKHDDSPAALSRRKKKAGTDAVVSRTKYGASDEDNHSDRTMIGDDFEHHEDGSDDSEDQNGERNKCADEEDDDFESRIEEGPGLDTHKGADDDSAVHTRRGHRPRDHDEDDKEEDGGTYDEPVEIHLYGQNKKVDLNISIPKGRSNDLEIVVQNLQPGIRAMQKRRQRKL